MPEITSAEHCPLQACIKSAWQASNFDRSQEPARLPAAGLHGQKRLVLRPVQGASMSMINIDALAAALVLLLALRMLTTRGTISSLY